MRPPSDAQLAEILHYLADVADVIAAEDEAAIPALTRRGQELVARLKRENREWIELPPRRDTDETRSR